MYADELRAERARTRPANVADWVRWNRLLEIRALAAMLDDPKARAIGGPFEDTVSTHFLNPDAKTAYHLARNVDETGTPATIETVREAWKAANRIDYYARGERLLAEVAAIVEPDRELRDQVTLAVELKATYHDLEKKLAEAERQEQSAKFDHITAQILDYEDRKLGDEPPPDEPPDEPPPDAPTKRGRKPSKSKPVDQAREFVERFAMHAEGPLWRRWRGDWYRWTAETGRYTQATDERIEACLYRDLGLKRPSEAHDVRQALIAVPDVLIDELEIGSWIGAPPEPLADSSPLDMATCPNGLLHLPSRTLHPATPRFFSTTALGVPYQARPGAAALWFEFLAKLWPNDPDAISALQEWFGYVLTPDTRLQKMLLLVGPKRSGKGTIMRTLESLLGAPSVAAPTLASLGSNFGLQPLVGKSLAIIGDARLGSRTDIAQVVERLLSISGEDAMTIDRKHRSPWTGHLSTRIAIVSNELPRFSDASDALPGRLVVLELAQSFFGREDPGLTEKLKAELPGILHWAIDGWHRLRRRGRFVQPANSAGLIADLEDLASPVAAWVRQRCIKGAAEQVSCSLAFDDFKSWSQEQGHHYVPTLTTFGRDLKAAAGANRMQVRDGLIRQGVYRGIRLRTREDNDAAL